MPLPIETLAQIVGFAVLIYLIARSRPAQVADRDTISTLLAQISALAADRDHWKELALRLEQKASELERDCQSYRGQIRRMNEDEDRRRQTGR